MEDVLQIARDEISFPPAHSPSRTFNHSYMSPLSEGTQSNMEFRAIVWPVLDGLWKSYASATKDFTSCEKLTLYRCYAINFSITAALVSTGQIVD